MKLLNNLLHNCEETSLSIIKSEESSLAFSEWLKMRIHIAFCKCCRNFGKQTKVIDRALQHHFHSPISDQSTKASQELKDRIKENLKNI